MHVPEAEKALFVFLGPSLLERVRPAFSPLSELLPGAQFRSL